MSATLSTDFGGLGLRSLAQHCHAAFLASRSSCYDLCRQLDSNHTFESGGDAPEYQAFRAYNNCVNDDKRLTASSLGKLSQKELSHAVDERTFDQLTAQGFSGSCFNAGSGYRSATRTWSALVAMECSTVSATTP